VQKDVRSFAYMMIRSGWTFVPIFKYKVISIILPDGLASPFPRPSSTL
jgi:hypothetical protein